MMGCVSGVATRLQHQFPRLIPVDCVAHKLELGEMDGVKQVKYLSQFEGTVKKIFLFYHFSPKAELSRVCTLVD